MANPGSDLVTPGMCAGMIRLSGALKGDETPIIVENVVNRIDEVVRGVRVKGGQSTIPG